MRDQRIGIGAHGVEGDVAKIKKSGETDDDVQAESEHGVSENKNGEIEQIPVAVKHDGHRERDNQKDNRKIG